MKHSLFLFIAVSASFLVAISLMILFIVLQVTVNPRNHPQEFSIIAGGDKRINYPGDSCHNLELNSFTPNIQTTAYLTTTNSIIVTKTLEAVLSNHTLEVGYDINSLTYYGIPVTKDDEVNLYIRSFNLSIDSLSVSVSVFDLVGFTQFLEDSNEDPLDTYSLNRNCLLTVPGCVITSAVRSTGWLYFVFNSTPTPSTLVVSIEATVRKYDLDLSESRARCTLSELSSQCFIPVPTETYYSDDDRRVNFLSFTITYETAYLVAPSAQSLNISADLSWTCSRTDLYSYIIVATISGTVSLVSFIILVVLIYTQYFKNHSCELPSIRFKFRRSRSRPSRQINIHRESVMQFSEVELNEPRVERTEKKAYMRADSLPPSYEKAVDAYPAEIEDEKPYFQT